MGRAIRIPISVQSSLWIITHLSRLGVGAELADEAVVNELTGGRGGRLLTEEGKRGGMVGVGTSLAVRATTAPPPPGPPLTWRCPLRC